MVSTPFPLSLLFACWLNIVVLSNIFRTEIDGKSNNLLRKRKKNRAKYYFPVNSGVEKGNIPCNSSGTPGEKRKKWQTNCVCNVVYESKSRRRSKKGLLACSQKRHFFVIHKQKDGKKVMIVND